MPRKMRIAKARHELRSGQLLQLITGYDHFHDGFGQNAEEADRLMGEVWEANREQVEEHHQQDRLRAHWPIYAVLRFDKHLSRAEALRQRSNSR